MKTNISGQSHTSPKISEITGLITMNFSPDVKFEAKNQEENLTKKGKTSRHANFTNFAGLSILTSEIDPENLRWIFAGWQFYRLICKMRQNAGL